MADWHKIKTEYITTDTSYRKLAAKHGVQLKTICLRSQKEKWIEQRQQFANETTTKTLNIIGNEQADRAVKLLGASDQLLCRVQDLLQDKGYKLDPKSMKHISGILKDIKDVQMIRSDADLREQEARIKMLEKNAEKDMENDDIHIVMDDEVVEYCG